MAGVRRSRWAAIGAAVAVSLGAGGLGLARASTGVESSFVSVTPARVLDTRTGLGLTGPLVSPTPRVLQVTGSIARPDGSSAVVVPSGASAVVLNVTVVSPSADGFLSVRPDGTPGAPETSNLNFVAGDIIPNAVTVALPSSGKAELTYDAFGVVGPTTDVLVDVTGFYVAASGGGGPAGPAGPQGPVGPAGADGVDASVLPGQTVVGSEEFVAENSRVPLIYKQGYVFIDGSILEVFCLQAPVDLPHGATATRVRARLVDNVPVFNPTVTLTWYALSSSTIEAAPSLVTSGSHVALRTFAIEVDVRVDLTQNRYFLRACLLPGENYTQLHDVIVNYTLPD